MSNHTKTYHIIVNAEEKAVSQESLTFDEVCKLAFPNGPFGGNILYTVTYVGPHGSQGSMVEGSAPIQLKKGMKFHVDNTDKS